MIKNKCKKTISIMLLMTMIVTTCNTNVFAGGEFSCIKVDNVSCENIFKCCRNNEDDTKNKKEEGEKALLVENKPSEVYTSETEVVLDSITPPTNIISTEVAKTENFAQTCEENTTSLGIPDDKGNCGDNVSYLFYKSTGELVIQGKGEMKSYLASEVSPWNKYKNEIQSVKIEDSVTSIGDRAFKDYTKLTSVILGNGIEKIGNNAFSGCIGLTSLELPQNVKKIDKFAFWKCKNLKSVSIPNSVRTIDDWAFRDCTGLKEIKIPNGVIEIGGSSFLGCTGLVSVTIPNSVEEIGEWAFSGCTSLNLITYLGKTDPNCRSAFNGCNIREIQVPPDYRDSKFCGFDKINKKNDTDFILNNKTGTLVIKRKGAMGDYSSSKISPWFNDKDKIKSVEIKDGVTYIGKRAFRDCKNLTAITIPATVKKISKLAFWKCTGLKSIDIPNNSIKTIDDWAFRECTSLKEIKIPNGVIKIGGSAFYGCERLISVTIPNSVTSIGEWAFCGCKNLNSVIYLGKIDLNCKSAFQGCEGLKEVSVPTGYEGRLFCGKAISK